MSDDAAILELEDRQDRILSRLEALRQEVDRLLAGEKSQLSKTASSCVDALQCPATNTSPAISKVSPASLQVAVLRFGFYLVLFTTHNITVYLIV